MKDEDGVIVGEEELVVDRWRRHFTKLFSGIREDVETSRLGVSEMEEIKEIELEEMTRELRNISLSFSLP